MPPANPVPLSPAAKGGVVAVAFLLATLIVRFTLECLGGAALVAYLVATGKMSPGEPMSDIPIAFTAGLTIVELCALAVLAVAFAFLLRPAAQTLGARIGSPWVYPVALIGGLTIGLSLGNLSEVLDNLIPDMLKLGSLDMIAEGLLHGPIIGRVLMVVAVTLAAPVCEELVFRGTLWGAIERVAPGWVAWLVTSVLFALYHLDPLHVILVFPVGLLIGWMRLMSGSVFPAMLLHFVNNTLAMVLVFTLHEDYVPPWFVAVICAGVSLVCVLVAFFGRSRPIPSVED